MTQRQKFFLGFSLREIAFFILLFCLAFFLRSYALYRDIVFAYDQGRDAWEVQKILQGNLTLIGPTTGLSGVFLGPFWFYLLTPLYFFGQGNPMVPAYFFVGLHAASAILLYNLTKKVGGVWAGAIASILFVVSFSNILFSRWLSNPTPLPFFSLVLYTLLLRAIEKKSTLWALCSGVVLGLCLQLEAANAVWFLLTVPIVTIWLRRDELFGKRSTKKTRIAFLLFLLSGGFGLGLTLLPQLAFELRHGFLSFTALKTSFATTHETTILKNLPIRLSLLFELYARGLFPRVQQLFWVVLIAGTFLLYVLRSKLVSSKAFWVLAAWFFVPLLFHTIYTGNHGNFWDYYIIAQHVPFYALIGSVCAVAVHFKTRYRILGIAFTLVVVLSAVGLNLYKWTDFIVPYQDRFSLSLQIDAANFMIDDAGGKPFGVWVYTPSAQDESHRYVFSYVGKKRGVYPQEHVEQQPRIYLVVEDDPTFAKRRAEWILEKNQFGDVVFAKKFGAVSVYSIENKRLFATSTPL